MLQVRVLDSLRKILPPGQVFTDRAALIAYEADAGMDKGLPEGVVFPRSVEEVARIVGWAAEHQVPLIARGAGTGLSGGAVADRGGIIVEFVHMQRILAVDLHGRNATVEPALINLRLDERVKAADLYFPPDPSSQRASTIGGNVAENSGGPHCFKYGVMTNYVIGMQLVLSNGRTITIGGCALDYPEYDLCGLITGSEGTLALITSITFRLLRNPPAVKTLLAIFASVEEAGDAVSAVIAAGLVPAAMEMMDQKIIQIIEPFAHANLPLDAGAVLIVEVDGYPSSLDSQMAEITRILAQHGGHDMRIARDEEERYKIWLARKSSAGAIAREAPAYYIVDITVPRSQLSTVLTEVNRICDKYSIRAGHVFHAGDGNLHPNLLIPEPDDPELLKRIHLAGWEIVKCSVDMGGSLTGEHGVGIEKRHYMSLMHNPAELQAMWDVKQSFDPDSLLNPGKIFPPPTSAESGPFAGYSSAQPAANNTLPTFNPCLPTTAQEAAQALLSFANAGQAVAITGRQPAQQAGTIRQLSTGALNTIQTYAPDDLYITVGAGTPLATIQTFLAQEHKQLALASPWPNATIGGLVAANVNAPQRMRYGALRDIVLCATVALPDGRVIRTGRPIVKNVAGYDLTKAFVGSYGTLGLLTDISLKIIAQPRTRRTLLFPINELGAGLALSQHLLALALNSSAIVLSQGYQRTELPQSNFLLAYTVEGMPEDVQAELTQVYQVISSLAAPEPHAIDGLTGTDIWSSMLQPRSEAALLLRISTPVSLLPAYIQAHADQLQQAPYLADLANGFLYTRCQFDTVAEAVCWLAPLRTAALTTGGYAVIMDLPDSWQTPIDRWGYRPEGLAIMRRLKAQWDTHGILNPDTFTVDLV